MENNNEFLKKLKESLVNGEKNEFVDKINNINNKANEYDCNDKIKIDKEDDEIPLYNEMNKDLEKIIKKYNELMELLTSINEENLSNEEYKVFEDIRSLIIK